MTGLCRGLPIHVEDCRAPLAPNSSHGQGPQLVEGLARLRTSMVASGIGRLGRFRCGPRVPNDLRPRVIAKSRPRAKVRHGSRVWRARLWVDRDGGAFDHDWRRIGQGLAGADVGADGVGCEASGSRWTMRGGSAQETSDLC